MDSELEDWLDAFAAAAREAAVGYATGRADDVPLPDPRALMVAVMTAYNGAVDVRDLIDAF